MITGHPRDIRIQDFTYDLPQEKIARYPLAERDLSRLLIWKDGNILEDIYRRLDLHLPENSLLVFNNTKVVEARILFQKESGGTIEVFCLEPDERYSDITTAMLQRKRVFWKCLVGGARKWKEEWLQQQFDQTTLSVRIAERLPDCFLIEFVWDDEALSFAELLHKAGLIPLPPYLERAAEESDKERYQTIYAVQEGSVAAPTAGLHFTTELLSKLRQKNIHDSYVTLHVGAGTFKPVKADTMDGHEMHAEFIDVSAAFIEQLLQHDGPVIAVGTTSLRTLESLYWIGCKVMEKPETSTEGIMVEQWDPYALSTQNEYSAKEALQGLADWMRAKQLERLITRTQIIIAPGYTFRIANALITNFHQPQSTLLLLVAAITGAEWRNIYDYAISNDFRFLSYGDGSLLWMPQH
jgi:S-adenosylmethionine:tRNA ribosyltransferase-isomerase